MVELLLAVVAVHALRFPPKPLYGEAAETFAVVRCAECGRLQPQDELWHLRFADIGEFAISCPNCTEREFGGDCPTSALSVLAAALIPEVGLAASAAPKLSAWRRFLGHSLPGSRSDAATFTPDTAAVDRAG